MSTRDKAIRAARRDFKAFHWGNKSTEILAASVPDIRPGDVLVVLGELATVEYDTAKGDEDGRYVHPFEDDRPLLCCTKEGRLVIVGGSYRVTPRGIVG